MAISLPNAENLPSGDLARTKNHEANDEWPAYIEIVAHFNHPDIAKRRKSVTISADHFFGRNGHNAPLSGDQILLIMDRLRRSK